MSDRDIDFLLTVMLFLVGMLAFGLVLATMIARF